MWSQDLRDGIKAWSCIPSLLEWGLNRCCLLTCCLTFKQLQLNMEHHEWSVSTLHLIVSFEVPFWARITARSRCAQWEPVVIRFEPELLILRTQRSPPSYPIIPCSGTGSTAVMSSSHHLHLRYLFASPPHITSYTQVLNFGLPPRCPQVVWCLWGEIEPFSATLAQDGLAECDQPEKNPLKYSAVAGNWTRATGRTDSELSHWAIMTDWQVK